jgi:hypothetical protein
VKHDYDFAALILASLDLRKFVEVNLYTNDAAHIQATVEFLRCFQTEGRFVRDLYEILIDIVQSELPHSVPPQRGYEALIGMLNWVMPLDLERALRVLVGTFYSKVCKQCMPAVQFPEYIDFRTRFTSLPTSDSGADANYAEHFPFDEVLLRPLSLEDQPRLGGASLARQGEPSEGALGSNKLGLLRDVVIHSERQSMCQTFQAKFEQESTVELVQIYFSDQHTAVYKLDVLVSVGSKLVCHSALDESSFARYVRYKRTGQSQKESGDGKPCCDEALRLPLSCEGSEVTVKLIYGHTSTSLVGSASKESSLPTTIVEFYGAAKDAAD